MCVRTHECPFDLLHLKIPLNTLFSLARFWTKEAEEVGVFVNSWPKLSKYISSSELKCWQLAEILKQIISL